MYKENAPDFGKPASLFGTDRDFFTRIRDSLEEANRSGTIQEFEAAAIRAHECSCNASTCQEACPLGKEIPEINMLLREVDFDVLITEFKEVMEQLQARIDECRHMTHTEYMGKVRNGIIREFNQILDEKPELEKELEKLKRAYDKQIERSPFAEFTGMLCPAPCETGGIEGAGCTQGATGLRRPVGIKTIENDLASLGFVLGWLDEKFRLPASLEKQSEKVVIAGAGPAGLEAAYNLAKKGINVVVYDSYDEVGGLLYRGIPDHKFEKERLIKYRILLEEMGVEFKLSQPLTKELYEIEAQTWGKEHTRLILATGTQHDPIRPTWVPGYDKVANLVDENGAPRFGAAIDKLVAHNLEVAQGKDHHDKPEMIGITGSGDTGIDVRQSVPRETGHLLAAGKPGHYVVASDRTLEPPLDRPRAGTGWGSRTPIEIKHSSTSAEDAKKVVWSSFMVPSQWNLTLKMGKLL